MKKITLYWLFTMLFSSFAAGQANDLIISEYGEGSSGNSKYVEIYNGTGADVTLTGNYQIWTVTNGGTFPENTYNFPANTVLADGDVFVIANNSTDVPSNVDAYSSIASWNGDDAVGLAKNVMGVYTLIDAIGEEGADPGTGWAVAGISNGTVDKTLTRKSSICSPNINWDDSRGVDAATSEWEVTSYTTGSPASLGNHTANCGNPSTPIVSFVEVTSSVAEGNSGSAIHTVDVSMNIAPGSAVTVSIADAATGSATAGVDYNFTTTSLTFQTTDTYPNTKTVSVTINGDTDIESSETIDLSLTITSGTANTGTTSHAVVITNDDLPTTADIRINEVNVTPAENEFIELYSENGYDLTGLVLIHYNGNGETTLFSYDLDGIILAPGEYYVICRTTNVNAYCDANAFASLQDGADAVALYLGDASDFPGPTTSNLIDALVYDTGQADDAELLTALGQTVQINENENGASATESIQRGSWFVAPETPGAANAALPVELLSFRAEEQKDAIMLFWQTASETHNDRFEIEHSRDGLNFEKIGEIAGAHNSHTILEYSFQHRTPYNNANYYRLKQVDEDGVYEYSKTISVFWNNNATILVRPNLVDNEMTVTLPQPATSDILLGIYDMQARLLMTEIIKSGDQSKNLDLTHLRTGNYIFRTNFNGTSVVIRFVKL